MENLSLSLQPPPPRESNARPPPPPPPHTAVLHSVRKPTSKPWKKPEPAPPKVYRVDPHGFRGLVQRLTGSQSQPQPLPRPLRDTVAPPPRLELAKLTVPPPPPPAFVDSGSTAAAPGPVGELRSRGWASPKAAGDHQSPASPLGFLSPSLYSAWCSFPLLSPGTLASLDHSPRAIL